MHPETDTADQVAIRDAEAVVERALDDERAALELRRRLRTEPLPTIEPDADIAAMLAPDERVITVREAVVVEGEGAKTLADEDRLVRLVVSTERLILIGRTSRSITLDQIDEVSVSGEQVLVSLVDGEGLCLDGGTPRLLRVQIAAARAGIRT